MGSEVRVPTLVEEARQERGISVAELARRIGTDRKRLWYVLHGQREMRVDEFLMLCVALGIDPRSFITRGMVEFVSEASKRKRRE
ncbi:transcriptional regulator [Gordonibacter sp. 28C]|uniref:helix-turn-helix domain-containing protein n=1 Tax=Gordonibacter sp. 28C TaxID=2078569 RepID=UPI000DF753DD|nr:helix-turn-helix domain-containing protein [Gordonibacter sp. 28C]RDB64310.1 transcriptional regulator [Gordonibacter sp. 28C]